MGPEPRGAAAVPRAVLRSWDEAEARLFPTIMARPDLYQQAVSLIQRLLGRLRETCPDLPAASGSAHWSIPNPAHAHPADLDAFRVTARELRARIRYLLPSGASPAAAS